MNITHTNGKMGDVYYRGASTSRLELLGRTTGKNVIMFWLVCQDLSAQLIK